MCDVLGCIHCRCRCWCMYLVVETQSDQSVRRRVMLALRYPSFGGEQLCRRRALIKKKIEGRPGGAGSRKESVREGSEKGEGGRGRP